MDDELEAPQSKVIETKDAPEGGQGNFSDDEDGGPDWTKMPTGLSSTSRPVIPKRGEKDYEPKAGSNLQQHLLERMRAAMFSVLGGERTISSKAISYGIWIPSLARAHVTTARGTHFTTMGYSVPRPVTIQPTVSPQKPEATTAVAPDTVHASSQQVKMLKRLELLPEEALYLVERGSMFCWKEEGEEAVVEAGVLPDGVNGTPMTVQQAYAEMIGRGDLTLERYQVYAYLRRLGFVVTRAQPPDVHYPQPAPWTSDASVTPSRRGNPLVQIVAYMRDWFCNWFCTRDWTRPLRISWPFHRFATYTSIFSALRIIPTGHQLPLYRNGPLSPLPTSTSNLINARADTPYKIFYNLYKPNTTFKKTAPPWPDFCIVVVDARKTPMPTLNELSELFDVVPEAPLPLPRSQRLNSGNKTATKSGQQSSQTRASTSVVSTPVSHSTPLLWLIKLFARLNPTSGEVETKTVPVHRPNPFAALKAGKKIVVIAAVDAGMISFFRFGQGEFKEWPMA